MKDLCKPKDGCGCKLPHGKPKLDALYEIQRAPPSRRERKAALLPGLRHALPGAK
jgi:hypothetical protein